MRFSWLTLPLGLLAAPARAQTVKLTVDVKNILEVKGKVQVALFSTAKGFPYKAKPAQVKIVAVTGHKPLVSVAYLEAHPRDNGIRIVSGTQVTFDVAPGDYALAVYWDLNSNGQMDRKLSGIPTEPYGFSNNVRPKMSAPSFADCRVTVGASGKQIDIRVQ